jgi:hypothetical protein
VINESDVELFSRSSGHYYAGNTIFMTELATKRYDGELNNQKRRVEFFPGISDNEEI